MIKLLIIADDITGTLDTGVKFSAAGVSTKIVVDIDYVFTQAEESTVLVLCVPTRHLPPEKAYQMVREVVRRAVSAGIRYIFKKTDSALRGNVGAELSAVVDASGESELCFIPALPAMNRVTREGVHYIDGIPVHQSVFGEDPFEPVKESYIPALLQEQCRFRVDVASGCLPPLPAPAEKRILVFDCSEQEEMTELVKALWKEKRFRLFAGCAGLAESLASYLSSGEQTSFSPERLIVLCGSVNPISRRQIDYAGKNGFYRVHVPSGVLLEDDGLSGRESRRFLEELWDLYEEGKSIILDTQRAEDGKMQEQPENMTAEEMRQRIAARMGSVLKALIDRGAASRLMIIGGDTLLAVLEDLGVQELTPLQELQFGVVLNRISYRGRTYELISKSGGFGTEDLLVTLLDAAKGP
ncbi:MAG: four-carbon acid sugar kinase family protein [Ruminococcaceae bacterium]|nr:four-carbon acid sugar kinase family protein [Oscillospiraceae bacterium]